MKPRSDYEAFESSSKKNRRMLRQEELILEVTEALAGAMRERGVTKSDLAGRLGKTRPFVTQILSGGRNLTLRTIADVAEALGYRVKVRVCQEARKTLLQTFGLVELPDWRGSERAPWQVKSQGDGDVLGGEGAAA
jgi:transcriptional regulator with XRE-family HTH domain